MRTDDTRPGNWEERIFAEWHRHSPLTLYNLPIIIRLRVGLNKFSIYPLASILPLHSRLRARMAIIGE